MRVLIGASQGRAKKNEQAGRQSGRQQQQQQQQQQQWAYAWWNLLDSAVVMTYKRPVFGERCANSPGMVSRSILPVGRSRANFSGEHLFAHTRKRLITPSTAKPLGFLGSGFLVRVRVEVSPLALINKPPSLVRVGNGHQPPEAGWLVT